MKKIWKKWTWTEGREGKEEEKKKRKEGESERNERREELRERKKRGSGERSQLTGWSCVDALLVGCTPGQSALGPHSLKLNLFSYKHCLCIIQLFLDYCPHVGIGLIYKWYLRLYLDANYWKHAKRWKVLICHLRETSRWKHSSVLCPHLTPCSPASGTGAGLGAPTAFHFFLCIKKHDQ